MTGPPLTLRVQSPGGRLTKHPLVEGETTIGRDGKAGLMLDDARVSRRHALLMREAPRVTVTDLASRNGTFLNGRRLGAAAETLAPGDVLKVGDFTVVFEPVESIPFAEEPAAADMRQVLQKAPDESAVVDRHAGGRAATSRPKACASSSTRRPACWGSSTSSAARSGRCSR